MDRHRSPLRLLVIALLALACILPAHVAMAQGIGNSITVEKVTFPVTVGGQAYEIVGYLYYEHSLDKRPLQVLVHGATYNHTYWDFPYPEAGSAEYSYARYMAARGYSVLAIDQLGAGESSKPAPVFDPTTGLNIAVTLYDTASAIHQVLTALRSGDNPIDRAFDRIVLVGHSAGSVNAIYVQATWHDADALVVTAARHLVPPLAAPPGLDALVLALLPYPYFPLDATIRTALFHSAAHADAEVLDLDNATSDLWTNGQLLTTFMGFLNPAIDQVGQVTGPVLMQLGEFDALFPAGQHEIETALWHPDAKLKIKDIARIGHSFNLHYRREASWEQIDEWIRETLGH